MILRLHDNPVLKQILFWRSKPVNVRPCYRIFEDPCSLILQATWLPNSSERGTKEQDPHYNEFRVFSICVTRPPVSVALTELRAEYKPR